MTDTKIKTKDDENVVIVQEKDVIKVQKTVLQKGNGTKPTVGQTITVDCIGSVKEKKGNKKFWSTKDPGQKAFSFQVGKGKVIKGWDAGCLTMSIGERSLIEMTGDYGYGGTGFPAWGIPPDATLIFEVEILSIK